MGVAQGLQCFDLPEQGSSGDRSIWKAFPLLPGLLLGLYWFENGTSDKVLTFRVQDKSLCAVWGLPLLSRGNAALQLLATIGLPRG
jgi:hypothetical protein